ncbi:glycine cleavage system H protein [Streptacidiphilus sp. BW17]
MANVPADLMYTADHEWVHVEKDGTVRVGITDFAQNALGDIVFLELPLEGRSVQIGDEIGTIESVKSVSELYSPVDGEVVAVNQDVVDSPRGSQLGPLRRVAGQHQAGGRRQARRAPRRRRLREVDRLTACFPCCCAGAACGAAGPSRKR